MSSSDVPSCGRSPLYSSQTTLRKRRSSKMLVTGEFSGVHSEQDKLPPACTTKEPSYTKLYSKTSSITSSSSNFISSFDDHIKSTKSIKPNTKITSEILCDGDANITCVGIEESDTGQRQSYAVLVGNTVRTINTKLYASLPMQDKFMVKQREQNLYGVTKVKLVLKSSHERLVCLHEYI